MTEADWEKCRDWIQGALDKAHGTHTIDDIWQGIREGVFDLWIGKECAVVTEIIQYPRKKALNYFLIGGNLDELQEIKCGIEAYARARGCDFVYGTGRRGWERVLPDMKMSVVMMVKEL